MASIRIRNKSSSGGIPGSGGSPGLTKGELAVNLADGVLWVGGTTDTPIYLSGVQSFNGLTGHVWGVTTGTPNTFAELNTFLKGISASGATLGTLVVNSGISASGGATFHNDVWVGGLLSVSGGISAAGGITFHNDVNVGNNLSVGNDLSYSGQLKRGAQAVSVITPYGSTNDLPRPGLQGEVVFVTGPTADYPGYGLYIWDGGASFEAGGVRGAWVRVTNRDDYRYSVDNGDGVIDGIDLARLLAAWGDYTSGGAYAPGSSSSQTFAIGIGDGLENAFEVKVFGATAGKKTSALKITSNLGEPIIFMSSEFTSHEGKFIVSSAPNEPAIVILEGGGYALFEDGLQVSRGATVGGNVTINGLLSVTGGISAGCGVTFGCLVNFTSGLSASGATLGTLVVNGGATFNGPVYMGATLTMNSNIRFSSTAYGIEGGIVDGGIY